MKVAFTKTLQIFIIFISICSLTKSNDLLEDAIKQHYTFREIGNKFKQYLQTSIENKKEYTLRFENPKMNLTHFKFIISRDKRLKWSPCTINLELENQYYKFNVKTDNK